MLIIQIILYFTLIFNLLSCLPIDTESTMTHNDDFNTTFSSIKSIENLTSDEIKPELGVFEYLNYTTFYYLTFSPTGQYLFFVKQHPLWYKYTYEHSLWLYNTETEKETLITKDLYSYIKPQWSPSGNYIALFLTKQPVTNITNDHEIWLEPFDFFKSYIFLYSVDSKEFLSIGIKYQIPKVFAWSRDDSSIYFVNDESNKYAYNSNTIYRIDFNRKNSTISTEIHSLKNISFSISEFLFFPSENKLVFTSTSTAIKNFDDSEIYSIDLQNLRSVTRLTNNKIEENQLQLSSDGKNVLFSVGVVLHSAPSNSAQGFYMLNLTNEQTTHFKNYFMGNIMGYAPKAEGGVYILGQWKTNVGIYSQKSSDEGWIYHPGFVGTYASIVSSSNPNCSIAFVYSESQLPMEIYCANNINDLSSAKQITNENELFTQRNLPQIEVYNWTNPDDHRIIEGILHYPPGKFHWTNLPLLVLIHGGPNLASLNQLYGNPYNWAPLAASNGWLVLEPNYRGSTGYGDEFIAELRGKPLSLAGKDILSGVDQLIKDGIADPSKLTVGGCSFGGSLTNWLITQTERFNAALSCSSSFEHVSAWGTVDAPDFYKYWFNGLPWEIPRVYQNEAPIYQMDKVRTPTYICTGGTDERVPASQSYILKRALDSREIPAKLQIFSNEGHQFSSPMSGFTKITEELLWLKKYGKGDN
ncbi:unnamed protein product [Adineta steineri]|uniref:Peptidase S9 prolyl oligopeptidase catalytic domain-containing protein n=1 Tax=Adineta steineri TaxID=433720 RepID=A0A814SDT3_9BILA|nr:unnamed protein product [Adineta steineri]CAF1306487.1 unnamed protein product [Adineta steineri]